MAAVAVLLGGCTTAQTTTMTEADARRRFDDVVQFVPPVEGDEPFSSAVRCVDEEAGVVIYAVENAGRTGGGLGLACVPIGETALEGGGGEGPL